MSRSISQLFLFLSIQLIAAGGFSQNLVPNPDFETFISCPTGFGQGGPLACAPWQNGSQATADFFQECSTSPDVDIPVNWFGNQVARSGNAYTGVLCLWPNLLWREYIQVQLTEPMIEGISYEVTFYVNCADHFCPTQNMGVYVSSTPPPSTTVGPIPVTPQIEAHLGYLSDTINWVQISGCYVAEGGEQWITIGNFYGDNQTPVAPGCEGHTSYYYIEDVSVQVNDSCKLPPLINGTVATKSENPIPDVTMHLSKDPGFSNIRNTNTDQDGFYSFNWLAPDSTYYVKGLKNTGVLQGISTLDLISMQKHLLGRTQFTSLHQYIASDIDHNGIVTVMDAVELRKTILGIYSEFPQNTSWRFGLLPQDFSGSDISTFEETAIIAALQDSATTIDFRGIKIGDVNGSIALIAGDVPIEIRHDDVVVLSIPNTTIEDGLTFQMDVRARDDVSMEGMQLALHCHDLTLISVEGVTISITDDNVSFTNDGLLRLSWNQDKGVVVSENDILFRLTFSSGSGGLLSEKISLAQEILNPEIYLGSQLVTHELNIDFIAPTTEGQNNSFRIDPNPLRTEAVISFDLPIGGDVDIHFYNLSGKLIYSIRKQYEAGPHSELIKAKDLSAGGEVICCRLVSRGYVGMQKLVLLK